MWDVLLLFSSICTAVAVGAPETVIGHRGERVDIRCPYDSGYESHSKYFCKGECNFGNKIIMVKSGSPAKHERFSLTDNTTARVFTVTITDLRTEDAGQYWCAVERTLTDVYSEILLLVKQDNKTTEVSTISPSSKTRLSYMSTIEPNLQSISMNHKDNYIPTGHISHAGSVIYICVGLVVIVIIFLVALMVFCKQRKSKKSPRITQSGLSQQVSVELLPLNTRAEITAEDIDWNEHCYQEISEFQGKNKHTTAIYTTAESPDGSAIYSTADKPDDPTIYSTADKPDDPMIYSTADKPDDPMIYSTADKPDEPMIYSTADKPDDPMIYSTADKPDDPMIYSTADKPDDLMIYSILDKPDDLMIYLTADDLMIYSTADKPDDLMIYSTADKPDDPVIYST